MGEGLGQGGGGGIFTVQDVASGIFSRYHTVLERGSIKALEEASMFTISEDAVVPRMIT